MTSGDAILLTALSWIVIPGVLVAGMLWYQSRQDKKKGSE